MIRKIEHFYRADSTGLSNLTKLRSGLSSVGEVVCFVDFFHSFFTQS